MSRRKLYVGIRANGSGEVFTSGYVPTEASHGTLYVYTVGPFRTRAGAEFMREYGRNNPHCQTVADAERLAKRTAKPKLYRCEAGRLISCDGVPLFTMHKVAAPDPDGRTGGYTMSPCEADNMARKVAEALNAGEVKRQTKA